MGTLIHDLRYAFRTIEKNPGFSLVAMFALALGIGANTAIFSVVNALLLRPLPYAEPERVVMVWESSPRGALQNVVAPADYLDWKAQNHVFDAMSPVLPQLDILTGAGEPDEIPGFAVGASFFPLLGVTPRLGRSFSGEEEKPGGPNVAVLSHHLWETRFGSNPNILGKSIVLDSVPHTVIGVMPARFRWLNRASEFWVPMRLNLARNYRIDAGRYMQAVAHLRPGVTVSEAQAEMSAIAKRLEREHPEFNTGWGVNLVTMRNQIAGDIKPALLVLLGAVGVVLLIACANVANLLLARAAGRQREMAIRTSLGATRPRIVQQLLTESVLLAVIAGIVGMVLAFWGIDLLVALSPKNLRLRDQIAPDYVVMTFTAALSLVTGILFGLVPAIAGSQTDLNSSLKQGTRTGAGGGSQRIRGVLVVAEVSLSLMLLVGAGLLIRSFSKLESVDPGFNGSQVLTARVSLPGAKYRQDPQKIAFFQQALAKIRTIPGVHSAGMNAYLPLTGIIAGTGFTMDDRPAPPKGQKPVTNVSIVDPDYFTAMSVPLLKGRLFSAHDNETAPRVYIVSESFARANWPGGDVLGQRIRVAMNDDLPGEIVGVVGDVRHEGLEKSARQTVYYAHPQFASRAMTFVIRTTLPPATLSNPVTAAIHSIDPEQPISAIEPMDKVLAESIARSRFTMLLLAVFASLAIVLAAVGIYGVISYSVTQRTQEIGLRMALGAERRDVLRLVLNQGIHLVAAGLAVGLLGSFFLTRLIASLLFELSPNDPATFLAVVTLLAAVALAATLIPALRATRVDPMVALRYE
jgi:putative ABC transport system permease protein